MNPCDNDYAAPHQTEELWPFTVSKRLTPGILETVGVDACVLPDGQPVTESDWIPAVVVDGTTNVLVADLSPGWHRVWASLVRDGRRAVVQLRTIHLT